MNPAILPGYSSGTGLVAQNSAVGSCVNDQTDEEIKICTETRSRSTGSASSGFWIANEDDYAAGVAAASISPPSASGATGSKAASASSSAGTTSAPSMIACL
jgi:hypothetical protein